jgi:hypothetical protein
MEENLGNWGAVAEPLADIMIEDKLSLNVMLTGIHAFLMALHASGHADAGEISEELLRMASYYRSLTWKQ